MIISIRPVRAGGRWWWRTYTPGGYDGWRTISGRRMNCGTMEGLK